MTSTNSQKDRAGGAAWSRLWLHVGPAKTGTTTIQKALCAARAALAGHGILFPRTPPNPYDRRGFAQHYLARALLADDFAALDAAFAGFPEMPETIVSSEMFPIARTKGYAALRDRCGGRYDIRPIYYVRHPIDRANSQAQQAIRTGNRTLAELTDVRPHVSLRRQISALADVFGPKAVTVRPFDAGAFAGGTLTADFCNAIGHAELAGLLPDIRENTSMTLETALAIERHRAATGDRSTISGADPRFRRGSTRFTLPVESRAAILAEAADDLDWLAETWSIDLRRRSEA